MRKNSGILYSVLIVTFFIYVNAISASLPKEPQKVYRYIYTAETHDWYVEQANLWKKEIEKDKKNPQFWCNYFMASKYSHWQGDVDIYKNLMDSILKQMASAIPDSYEYNYLKYYNGDRDIRLLEKAYEIDPKRPDALYEFILHYEKFGETEKLKKVCEELYQTRDIAPGLLNYNYNMLASTEPNAILFTNGDNDSYPSWVVQNTFGIREDVSVVNLHLTFVDREYLNRKLAEKGIDIDSEKYNKVSMPIFIKELVEDLAQYYPEIPVYLAVTVYKKSMAKIEDNLYIVGLAFKYSPKRFDNNETIKYNIENNLRLDYLDYDWYAENYLVNKGLDQLHMNYVVFFLKYAEDLYQSGKKNIALQWKQKALLLATRVNNTKIIEHINDLEW